MTDSFFRFSSDFQCFSNSKILNESSFFIEQINQMCNFAASCINKWQIILYYTTYSQRCWFSSYVTVKKVSINFWQGSVLQFLLGDTNVHINQDILLVVVGVNCLVRQWFIF